MEEMKHMKIVKTPAAEYFLTVNPNAKNIDAENVYVLHTTIDKSIFLCKRSRSDIQYTVPFVCTIFKGPDEHDCKKLLIMIKYIQ